MKKILFVCVIALYVVKANAQLYSSGNNIIVGNNVGIGTNVPATSLDVRGTNPIIGTQINSGTLLYAALTAKDSATNRSVVQLMGGSAMAGQLFGVNRAGAGQFYTNSAPLVIGTVQPYDLTLGTNNAANITIKNGGFVGINNVNPLAQFSVNGNALFSNISSNPTSAAFIRGNSVYSTATTPEYTWWNNDQVGIFHPAANVIGFTIAGIEKMRIAANGNVGIGTSAPIQNLDISGRANVSNGVIQKGGTAITSTSDLGLYSQDPSTWMRFVTTNQPIRFFSDGNIGINANMSIEANGNVGIGISAPIQKLDVNGRMNISYGVIQKGGAAITNTGDLGLYSLDSTSWMRFVTTKQPIRFFSDGNIGTNANMSIESNGNIGIGTSAPTQKLHVHNGAIYVTGTNSFGGPMILFGGGAGTPNTNGNWGIEYSPSAGGLNFWKPFLSAGGFDNFLLFLGNNGNVGIGTNLASNTYNNIPNYFKLSVNGSVRAKELVINTGWSDFVFEKNYKLNSLENVEKYIEVHGHLPEIPSAKEIETNGGNLGELLKLQMQKIEELTLYIIAQNKRIETLEMKNKK